MFTGLIECRGRLLAVDARGGDVRMRIACEAEFLRGVRAGDSIAVNGVCLTAIELAEDAFSADLSAETLGMTTAADWQPQASLNLETALTLDRPLGGHMVSGHVDGLGTLLRVSPDARSVRMVFQAPAELMRYIARKGSITVDGVSLTVNSVEAAEFGVNIVPHTLDATSLGELHAGDAVNLEVDLVARYLERLLQGKEMDQ